jgi:hypothetical protein
MNIGTIFKSGSTPVALLMFAAAILAVLFSAISLDSQAKLRPNIVFILSDDEDLKSRAFMPKNKSITAQARHLLRELFCDRVALLPFSHLYSARAVSAQHQSAGKYAA